MTNATLTRLDAEQVYDVKAECVSLRAEIARWEHVRGYFGRMEADRIRGHRHAAMNLQGYVRYARMVGLDIMPVVRAEFGKPQIKGRRSVYSHEERLRAIEVLDAARH